MHRIGRTARLGAEGDAISFACDLYAMSLPDIETYIGQRIPVANIEPDMLVMPKPREQDAEFMADAAADSAAFGDKVEAREKDGSPSKRSGSRNGRGRDGERPARSDKPREPRKPRVEVATQESAVAVATPAETVPATANGETIDGVERKRRRRRGGRGRRRDGDAPAVETAANPAAENGRAPRGERRSSRERGGADAAHARPSRQVAITSGVSNESSSPKKDGFFRRLGRFFTGR